MRRVVIGTSVEGRPLEGLEIARDVDRRDDGRPVHLELGLTHAREWASGEIVMEFAHDLATSDAPRLAALRAHTRTFLFPVVNPDGFASSRSGTDADQRKNAREVDLNRNFGAFWGGPGASDDPSSETYRGPGPFSEPEAQALREWGSEHQVVVANSLHTYGGTVLYQPGFRRTDEPGLPAWSTLPGTARFAKLGERMAEAAGYVAAPAYDLYDVTGAAEDWNYFNQYAYAYTIEIAGTDHQGPFSEMVADQYDGLRGCAAAGRRGRGGPARPRAAARPRPGRPHVAADAHGALVHLVRPDRDGRPHAEQRSGPIAGRALPRHVAGAALGSVSLARQSVDPSTRGARRPQGGVDAALRHRAPSSHRRRRPVTHAQARLRRVVSLVEREEGEGST